MLSDRTSQPYGKRDQRLVYRIRLRSRVLLFGVGGFIAFVWTVQIFNQPAPPWLRASGAAFLIVTAVNAWRWGTVSVVVAEEGVRVRGVWSARAWRWAAINGLTTRPSIW